jgi:hypothetical protein
MAKHQPKSYPVNRKKKKQAIQFMKYTNAFDKVFDRTDGHYMKAARKSLTLLAVSTVLCGTAQAQDQAALTHQGVATNAPAHVTVATNPPPTLAWGSRTQVSGLFVDLIRPRQTWAMLKPSGPTRDPSAPIPPNLLPVTEPRSMNDNLAVHEPGIALLRFSF